MYARLLFKKEHLQKMKRLKAQIEDMSKEEKKGGGGKIQKQNREGGLQMEEDLPVESDRETISRSRGRDRDRDRDEDSVLLCVCVCVCLYT